MDDADHEDDHAVEERSSSAKLSRALSVSSPVALVFERQSSIVSHPLSEQQGSAEYDQKQKKKLFRNRKDKVVLISVVLFYFSVFCAYGMIAPFFPGEAKKKGSNGTITGLIFAVFPLVVFVFSPVAGMFIPQVGPKFTLISGLLIEGGAQILFGFLDMMPDGNIFIIFCFLIRITLGLGSACTATASLTIVTQNFQHKLATAVGFTETSVGVGLMAGPPIGGFLYSLGGFRLPFLVLGCVILSCMCVIFCALPPDKDIRDGNKESGSMLKVVKVPGISMVAFQIAVAGMVLSFLDPTLEHHLTRFHLGTSKIGLMFLIIPGLYGILAPSFGWLADKGDTRLMLGIGPLICSVGYIFLGPTPLLKGIPKSIWLNAVSLSIIGIGAAPSIVPSLPDMIKTADVGGLPNDITTHSILSGLFNAMYTLGSIAGPTAGGVLVETLSFAWASTIFAGVLILWAQLDDLSFCRNAIDQFFDDASAKKWCIFVAIHNHRKKQIKEEIRH